MEELKSCPFCGENKIKNLHPNHTNWFYRVMCECEATGPTAEDKQQAIDAWNGRKGEKS